MPSTPSLLSNKSNRWQHPSGRVSPTLTETSSASAFHRDLGERAPPVVVTRADLKHSLEAYETLLSTAKTYRNALISLATATSALASAFEDCARQKGASAQTFSHQGLNGVSPGEQLMAAAGLHHLLGNHHQILGDSFYRQFEVPLMDEYDTHKQRVADRQAQYELATQEKAKLIRETEARNVKLGRKKLRDLSSFRRALSELQNHVNDLDNLKIEHYSEVYENEQEMWELIASKTSIVVKSEIDLFDKIVTKGSSDSVLEIMQQANPDPFAVYGHNEEHGHIFSILPPLSILNPASSLSRTNQVTPPLTKPSSSAPASLHSPSEPAHPIPPDTDEENLKTPVRTVKRQLSMINEGETTPVHSRTSSSVLPPDSESSPLKAVTEEASPQSQRREREREREREGTEQDQLHERVNGWLDNDHDEHGHGGVWSKDEDRPT